MEHIIITSLESPQYVTTTSHKDNSHIEKYWYTKEVCLHFFIYIYYVKQNLLPYILCHILKAESQLNIFLH